MVRCAMDALEGIHQDQACVNEEGKHSCVADLVGKRQHSAILKACMSYKCRDQMVYKHKTDGEGAKDVQVGAVSHWFQAVFDEMV